MVMRKGHKKKMITCHICKKEVCGICLCGFCFVCIRKYGHEECSRRYKEAEAHFFVEDDVSARKEEEK